MSRRPAARSPAGVERDIPSLEPNRRGLTQPHHFAASPPRALTWQAPPSGAGRGRQEVLCARPLPRRAAGGRHLRGQHGLPRPRARRRRRRASRRAHAARRARRRRRGSGVVLVLSSQGACPTQEARTRARPGRMKLVPVQFRQHEASSRARDSGMKLVLACDTARERAVFLVLDHQRDRDRHCARDRPAPNLRPAPRHAVSARRPNSAPPAARRPQTAPPLRSRAGGKRGASPKQGRGGEEGCSLDAWLLLRLSDLLPNIVRLPPARGRGCWARSSGGGAAASAARSRAGLHHSEIREATAPSWSMYSSSVRKKLCWWRWRHITCR